MVSSLLTEAEARDVEAAVARLEGQTSAEVVVAVVSRSDDYWRPRVLLALAWALAAGVAYLHFAPWREPAWALLLQALVGVAVFALSSWRVLQRPLISAESATEAVHARAFQLFAERGLHGTRGRTALLVFVSELERRVVLLGDQSVHARLGQRGWDEHVELLVSHLRRGETCAGLLAVLERLTPELAAVAPRAADDENELSNRVLRG